MMIDIHTHILPQIDDGSRSVIESEQMLEEIAGQGIETIIATPHFYAWDNTIEDFLYQRERAMRRLKKERRSEYPRILMGAEVYYFDGMSRCADIKALCIEGSKMLLMEMPFDKWTRRMLREISELQLRHGIRVVLAHIERYLDIQKNKDVWEELLSMGVWMQCNAEFFISLRTRYKAKRMLRQGKIHLLGSDCHNMDTRRPCMGTAMKIIGADGQRRIHENLREGFDRNPIIR